MAVCRAPRLATFLIIAFPRTPIRVRRRVSCFDVFPVHRPRAPTTICRRWFPDRIKNRRCRRKTIGFLFVLPAGRVGKGVFVLRRKSDVCPGAHCVAVDFRKSSATYGDVQKALDCVRANRYCSVIQTRSLHIRNRGTPLMAYVFGEPG